MDERAVATDELARQFRGLPAELSHRQVLTTFKRAAPYLGIPPRLVHAIDTLMSWSRPQDWCEGQRPIVFPSNETLSQKLGIGVRQVQKMLAGAARCGLVAHRDSANGNRIGARGADGRLVYAYGIDLSPLGVRHAEFAEAVARGTAADHRIDLLRRRLAAARRRIRSLAQLVADKALDTIDADTDVEIALLATRQARHVRDEALLTACVEDIERRSQSLGKAVAEALKVFDPGEETENSSPSGVAHVAAITTTKTSSIAKASYSNGDPKKSREGYDVRNRHPQTETEADLDKHGVNPAFIASVVPELLLESVEHPDWGSLIGAAERLVDQAGIGRGAWHEACRLMGQKGAAASVIATTHKHMRGIVERPGAYLRGMNRNAAASTLNLGRTFHGLRDEARDRGMRSIAEGTDPRPIGGIAAAILRKAGGDPGGRRLL